MVKDNTVYGPNCVGTNCIPFTWIQKLTVRDLFPIPTVYATLPNSIYFPLQLKLFADFSITESSLICCRYYKAATCQILQLEAYSIDHLMGIMTIQRATLGDELTFNQPTNYTACSENGLASSSAQTYKMPAGMTNKQLSSGRRDIIRRVCSVEKSFEIIRKLGICVVLVIFIFNILQGLSSSGNTTIIRNNNSQL